MIVTMKFPLIHALSFLLLPILAHGQGILTIRHDTGDLSFGQWEYREISTASRFCVGCQQWDVLGSGGWFPSTWYHYIDPNDQLEYQVDRSLRARFCNAQPDEINFLRLTHTTSDGDELEGFLRVYPDATATETSITVRCAPAGVIDSPCWSCSLTCEPARLPWDGRGTAEITVVWEDLV